VPPGGPGEAAGSCRRAIRLGTDCSGAEAPYFALREIQSAMAGSNGPRIELDHVFACDVTSAPRAFIQQNCKPQALFADIRGRESISHCLLQQRPRRVPSNLDIYVAGFPCKDFSLLNSSRPCLAGPHAAIFTSVVKYIRRNEPATFILENVSGITMKAQGGGAPIYEVMQELRSIPNYQIRGWDVNSRDYGVPQNRKRVYIVGVHTSKANLRLPLAEWSAVLKRLRSTEAERLTAEDFLLPDDHPAVVQNEQYMEERSRIQARGPRQSHLRSCNLKCIEEAESVARKEKISEAEREAYFKNSLGWSKFMALRGRIIVGVVAARIGKKRKMPAEKTSMIADVSQSILRCNPMEGVTPCITPSGRFWIFKRRRWILPMEKLALQGFPCAQLDLSGFSPSEIESLAGNSMSLPAVGAFLVMVLAFVELPAE